ncbi:hypothetical protein [Calycomorphotria hydatis]|uniref:Uncharacterized protein n=1 Tax=Calycomorphotria hydatis TaxID=2528027 RepID=A0A517TDM3_9PLAN|nr:hypothetical protein [Calycomorphotria hydatis]QDT66475.1 hypothetical protein V22_37430 [Calycomorphotria hydatis]
MTDTVTENVLETDDDAPLYEVHANLGDCADCGNERYRLTIHGDMSSSGFARIKAHITSCNDRAKYDFAHSIAVWEFGKDYPTGCGHAVYVPEEISITPRRGNPGGRPDLSVTTTVEFLVVSKKVKVPGTPPNTLSGNIFEHPRFQPRHRDMKFTAWIEFTVADLPDRLP